MANSDYEMRGSGDVTPSCDLRNGMGEGTSVIAVDNFTATDGTLPAVGQGIMIGNEIMRINAVDMPYLTVGRGCADTIPQPHKFGDKVWFITVAVGGDQREYMATETIGVKVLMKSTGGVVPIRSAPPNRLTFNHRFARPYPPGRVRVNDRPWWSQLNVMNAGNLSMTLTWAHRNRITQDDTLQDHSLYDIAPELGTTYRVEIRDGVTDAILASYLIEEGVNSFVYTMNMARVDLAVSASVGLVDAVMVLYSQRDAYTSMQAYRIRFVADVNDILGGWGRGWGNSWSE